jgi:hypothetical protein
MRNKLKSMLEIWKDAGFIVHFTLSGGDVIAGRLKEIDSDEVIVEPEYDGQPGPLTVIMLHHVAAVTYLVDQPET